MHIHTHTRPGLNMCEVTGQPRLPHLQDLSVSSSLLPEASPILGFEADCGGRAIERTPWPLKGRRGSPGKGVSGNSLSAWKIIPGQKLLLAFPASFLKDSEWPMVRSLQVPLGLLQAARSPFLTCWACLVFSLPLIT